VDAVYRFSPFYILKTMRRSKVFLFGGGNIPPGRHQPQIPALLRLAASFSPRRSALRPCFTGRNRPVNTRFGKWISKKALNRTDVITLREPDSLRFLYQNGVSRPKTLLTADETLTLPDPKDADRKALLLREGIDPLARLLFVSVRTCPKTRLPSFPTWRRP
jgi:polysaccharide pyruvyl transferase WcaK-like protein